MDMSGNDNTPEWGYCQHDGCENAASPYWLPDSAYPDDADGFYCEEHAANAGWCWGCGGFWGGVESFDFNPRNTGLCENCEPGYLRDMGEYDDWGEDDAEWDDMPHVQPPPNDTALRRGEESDAA